MKNTKSGQYAPRQNDFPKPEPMASSNQSKPASSASQQSCPTGRPSPVRASAIADETMQRADEYVQQKKDEISKNIKDFGDNVAKIPKDVPVTMSDDIRKVFATYNKNVEDMNRKVKEVEEMKNSTNKWHLKVLAFAAAIIVISAIQMTCTSVKYADANQRFKEADKKWQEANAVVLRMDSIQKERDIRHDFGEWMIRRHGEYGNEYSLFKQENKYRNR